jgi:hypothetical protein
MIGITVDSISNIISQATSITFTMTITIFYNREPPTLVESTSSSTTSKFDSAIFASTQSNLFTSCKNIFRSANVSNIQLASKTTTTSTTYSFPVTSHFATKSTTKATSIPNNSTTTTTTTTERLLYQNSTLSSQIKTQTINKDQTHAYLNTIPLVYPNATVSNISVFLNTSIYVTSTKASTVATVQNTENNNLLNTVEIISNINLNQDCSLNTNFSLCIILQSMLGSICNNISSSLCNTSYLTNVLLNLTSNSVYFKKKFSHKCIILYSIFFSF